MNFTESVQSVLGNYAVFNGRASRSEYWNWVLFHVMLLLIGAIADEILGSAPAIYALVLLAMAVPSLAVGARRLHDINKSGWNQLWVHIPLLGWLYIWYLAVRSGDVGTNDHGDDPSTIAASVGGRALRLGTGSYELAGFGARLVAYCIDGVVYLVVIILGIVLDAAINGGEYFTTFTAALLLLILVGEVAVQWMFNSLGWSLGQRMLGLRIIDEHGGAPGVGRGLDRTLGAWLSVAPLYVGHLWGAWDRQKQTWQDKIAGTYVVRTRGDDLRIARQQSRSVDQMTRPEILAEPPGYGDIDGHNDASEQQPAAGPTAVGRRWYVRTLLIGFPVSTLLITALLLFSWDGLSEASQRNRHGVELMESGNIEEAIANYDRAIELDPDFARAYQNRGVAYGRLGDFERAIADLDRAVELGPDLPVAYNNRGTVYLFGGNFEQAIADFDRAIELDPDRAVFYENRSLAYRRVGDLAAALSDLETALSLPNDPSVRGQIEAEIESLEASK